MNQTKIEEYGLQPLKEIHASLGGWPCVDGDDWNPNSTWNWQDGNKNLLHAGFGHAYLFVISIDTDMRNSSRKRIVVCEACFNIVAHLKHFLIRMNNSLTNQPLASVVNSY